MAQKTVTTCDRCKKVIPDGEEKFEVKTSKRMFRFEICKECNGKLTAFLKKPKDYDPKLLEMLDALLNAAILSKAYGKWLYYPWRSFDEGERRNLRNAMTKGPIEWAEGCAGYVDKLEMVRFESGGKTAEQIKRTI